MKIFTYKQFISVVKITLLLSILLVGLNFVDAAWSGPSATPPTANTPTPINIGTENQIKSGGLGIDALSVFGDGLITGRTTAQEFCFSGGLCITSWDQACGGGGTPTPSVNLTASPTSVTNGNSSTLTWLSSNVTSCSATNSWTSSTSASGSQSVSPTTNTTYAITCTGDYGSVSNTATVTVNAATPTPTVTLTALPLTVNAGTPTSLKWTSTNATSCSADFKSPIATNNSTGVSVSPTTNTTYSITCSGAGGSVTNTATVSVNKLSAGFNSGSSKSATVGATYLNGASYDFWWTSYYANPTPGSSSWPIKKEIINLPTNVTCVYGCGGSVILPANVTSSVTTLTPTASATPGTYNFQFKISMQDFLGNLIEEEILDAVLTVSAAATPNSRPVITLLGTTPVSLTVGDTYTDAGATANDNEDGDITTKIVTVNPVDTSIAGTYTVTYNVSDSQGLSAIQVSRSVIVSAAATPTVTLGATDGIIDIIAGNSTTLTWSSTNATSCSAANNWTTSNAISGSQLVSPTTSTTYSITCKSATNSAITNITINVSYAIGDVDMNGVILLSDMPGDVPPWDAILVQDYIAGTQTLSTLQLALADANNDGEVTNLDVELILEAWAGKIELPYERAVLGNVDLSADGSVLTSDALMVSKYVEGTLTPTLSALQLVLADVNTDGQVTNLDAELIKEASIGIIQLPYERAVLGNVDLSADGSVLTSDALMVSKYVEGTLTPTLSALQLVLADVNTDGQVTNLDAELIKEASIGIIQLPFNTQIGDVNFDGAVNAIDANLIIKHLQDPTFTLSAGALELADVNGDGVVNIEDSNSI